MIDIVSPLKSWLKGLEIVKLAKACQSFWEDVEQWLELPEKQRNLETCHELAVAVHGWGRRVERFPGESSELYRNRVWNAFQNTRDAGLVRGLEDILTRFQVAEFKIHERMPYVDPDVVTIALPQGGITNDQVLLLKIFQEYGLTCRRYAQTVNDMVDLGIQPVTLEHNQETESL